MSLFSGAHEVDMGGFDVRQVQWTVSSHSEGVVHQRGPIAPPGEGGPPKVTETWATDQNLKEHIATALATATDIISHTCVGGTRLKISPIQLLDDETSPGVIMSTSTFIALAEWNGTLAWVPTALLRGYLSPSGLPSFTREAPYDMQIFVNRDCKFAMSDPSCAFARAKDDGSSYFSSVTVLVHEILHGMGMFSIGKDPALLGNATHPNRIGTPWDNLLRDRQGRQFVPVARAVNGQQVAGVELHLDGIAIYNPLHWEPGSSLSHFSPGPNRQTMMAPSIDTGTCLFRLPSHITSTLNLLGWECNVNGTPASLEWDHGTIYTSPDDCPHCITPNDLLSSPSYLIFPVLLFLSLLFLYKLFYVIFPTNKTYSTITLKS